MKKTLKSRLEVPGRKVGSPEELLALTAAERAAVAEGITSFKSGQGKLAKAVFSETRQDHGLRGNRPARPQKHTGGPPLPPPAGYSSWLAYAVATMDDRSLDNDHDEGHQPQWPASVTRAQMRAAARAELEWIEGIWNEMERAWAGEVETAEITANPKAMKAIKKHKAGKTKFGKLRDI